MEGNARDRRATSAGPVAGGTWATPTERWARTVRPRRWRGRRSAAGRGRLATRGVKVRVVLVEPRDGRAPAARGVWERRGRRRIGDGGPRKEGPVTGRAWATTIADAVEERLPGPMAAVVRRLRSEDVFLLSAGLSFLRPACRWCPLQCWCWRHGHEGVRRPGPRRASRRPRLAAAARRVHRREQALDDPVHRRGGSPGGPGHVGGHEHNLPSGNHG